MSLAMASPQENSSDLNVDRLLLAELENFGSLALSLGIPNRAVSQKGIEKLATLSTSKKLEVISYLKIWSQWICSDIEGSKVRHKHCEKSTLRKALDYYGLDLHEDFWNTMTEDQFVEIYSPDMIQMYRSLSFLGISGYSIMDLMTTEWYHLWERPKRVTEELLKTADKYANSYVPVQRFPVQKHLLREIYITGLTEPFIPRATLVEFQYIGTLLDRKTKLPAGFICTSTGHIVADGKEAESLDFV